MTEASNAPRSPWQQLWRRTSLTSKALVVSLCLGLLFWLLADYWQTVQVKAIFHQKLLKDLDIQAQRDRILFDEYIRQQEQSVRMLSFLTTIVHHVERASPGWVEDASHPTQWTSDHRPPWLPPRSVMRGLVAAPYIVLLDGEKRLREIFYREEGLPPLPDPLLQQSLPDLLATSEHSHILSAPNDVVYLITTAGVQDGKREGNPRAFIALIAPMNDDFLAIFHTRTETNSVVTLMHGETDRVFASSQPDRIPAGTVLAQLQSSHIVFGKKFLDYSFAINVPIHFATLIPLEEIAQISAAIVHAERQQRTIGYALLAAIFLGMVFAVTRSVQRFTAGMVETAFVQLGLSKQHVDSGDQLLIMGEQFQWMTEEILRSRRREKIRQLDLQMANEALQQSLVMVKRTQSQLVEAEKMASLGSLVAGVAHEINTPVGTGVTAASFLAQTSQECSARFAEGKLRKSELESFFLDVLESTQMILSNLQRAAELIRSFKQVAVDRANEELRTFRLHEYIHHVLLSLRARLKQTQHEVTVQCPEALEVTTYPGALSQIISNLLVNSLVHAFQEEEEGKILFQVVEREGDILFCYSDNGCGMEEKDRARIFEPFFTTARQRGGSGLGMHIVFNLVTQHLKGSIRCVSTPGRGTLYEIYIPKTVETVETGI
ncbi:MAG: HAMP domain-containing histidine kinase [Magnetococcus sp. YQC-3]